MSMISVIVPVYGVEKYIRKSMESLCAQTYTDFEVIIVDDESPDNSGLIAQEILKQNHIKYKYFRKCNEGLSNARQFGIDNSSGEWIAFLDSDDTIDPHFLEQLMSLVINNNTQIGIVSYELTYEKTEYQSYYDASAQSNVVNQEQMLKSFLVRQYKPVLPGFIINRVFLKQNRIVSAPHCRFSEDEHYMWQLFFVADRVAVSDLKLYHYVQRSNSISYSSKAENIMTGYNAFVQLINDHEDWINVFPYAPYILPRWVLGALRTTAAISKYDVFVDVATRMNDKFYMKQLNKFPEFKARVLAFFLRISRRLFYYAVRLLG